MDDLSLKVDEIDRPILLEARSKKGKPWTGAFRVACTQADTPPFERVLLDHLGHQDLQFHAEEYGMLGIVRHSDFEDGGTSVLCWAHTVHPDVFGHGFGRATRLPQFKKYRSKGG